MHKSMFKIKVMKIVNLFQKKLTVMTAHSKEKLSTYIMLTTKLISVDYILHKI